MKRFIPSILLACALIAAGAPAAIAAVNVTRTGDENPMKEVAKSVIYGGLAGLVLGTALAVATKNNSNDDQYIRWGFASGAFLGFGMGLYWVTARPSAALIEVKDGGVHLGALQPTVVPGGGTRLSLVAVRF